ncbi:hypothetical protein D6D12_03186 [Aureobasidium pullulans]|uniref:Uncharacterized protein n=1 Tax=Aureobasidium pullulans TaxID=5580 RepID=A0AB74JYR5_AURPU|nr:hypothetical protein D6D11_10610 [Aureobasidium pullulans]THX31008.1 hypothetical protein D6D12_03186 [Aureobasidium pullulans]
MATPSGSSWLDKVMEKGSNLHQARKEYIMEALQLEPKLSKHDTERQETSDDGEDSETTKVADRSKSDLDSDTPPTRSSAPSSSHALDHRPLPPPSSPRGTKRDLDDEPGMAYSKEKHMERLSSLCEWVPSKRLMETVEKIYPEPGPSETGLTDPRICVYFQHYRWIFLNDYLFIGRWNICYIPQDVWYKRSTINGVLEGRFYLDSGDDAEPRVLDPLRLDKYFECVQHLLEPSSFESRVPFELYLQNLWCLVRAFPCTHAKQGRLPGEIFRRPGPWKFPMWALEHFLDLPDYAQTVDQRAVTLYLGDITQDVARKVGFRLRRAPLTAPAVVDARHTEKPWVTRYFEEMSTTERAETYRENTTMTGHQTRDREHNKFWSKVGKLASHDELASFKTHADTNFPNKF